MGFLDDLFSGRKKIAKKRFSEMTESERMQAYFSNEVSPDFAEKKIREEMERLQRESEEAEKRRAEEKKRKEAERQQREKEDNWLTVDFSRVKKTEKKKNDGWW